MSCACPGVKQTTGATGIAVQAKDKANQSVIGFRSKTPVMEGAVAVVAVDSEPPRGPRKASSDNPTPPSVPRTEYWAKKME